MATIERKSAMKPRVAASTVSAICDIGSLHRGITDSWKSIDVAKVNGNTVRFRVMENVTANWHTHVHSDELFYVLSGTVYMDTEYGTQEIRSGQLFVVPLGTLHRARVTNRATLLVIDSIF
jgi:mannose-6-phosphate isomerase-like protein (cupin superfamily)